jgi:hypothetical protein
MCSDSERINLERIKTDQPRTDQTHTTQMQRLILATHDVNQTIQYGGNARNFERFAKYAFALSEVNTIMVTEMSRIIETVDSEISIQMTHDLANLWSAELESAHAMRTDLLTAKTLKRLLSSMETILEGHAKTLCWTLQTRRHNISRKALEYYGGLHIPLWNRALDTICMALGTKRDTEVSEIYAELRKAAGIEPAVLSQTTSLDMEMFDLNESDVEYE